MDRDRARWPLTLALCGGYFLVLLDVTVVNVALPQIGSGLDADGARLAWVVDAYAVPLAALLLASGAIGDRLGHRRVVLLGLAGFGAASVLCALAPSVGILVTARALQGSGAALMLPGTLALLVEETADEGARSRLVGVWAAIGGTALPAGPVIGGLLVQSAGWRAVFWLGVPVTALAVIPVLRLSREEAGRARAGTVDRAGAALLVAGLGCLVTAIIQGPGSPGLGAFLGAAAAGTAVWFVTVERRTEHPLLTVPRGARGTLAGACVVAGLMNLCVLGGLFLLTQFFQDVRGLSPLSAGLATTPAMVPLPFLGAPAGRLSARIGVWRAAALGLLVAAGGFAGIAATVGGSGYAVLLLFLALWGTGLGILTPSIVSAALLAVPGAPGVASGAGNTSRQTGGALGVAIFAAVAGPAGADGFLPHCAGLFAAGALVFALLGVLCLAVPRAPGPGPA
ncbi:MFS transporter [Streptomyces sp. NPDC020983]|uniref:MFS transporter n=1 Tax=Streptomyces sp. NPDC020983 TaxID=3365106 RepID=UPI0037B6EB6D